MGYQTIELPLDGEVDVRRSDIAFGCRIPTRLDRSEAVPPRHIGDEPGEASEMRIKRRRVFITWMTVLARDDRSVDPKRQERATAPLILNCFILRFFSAGCCTTGTPNRMIT